MTPPSTYDLQARLGQIFFTHPMDPACLRIMEALNEVIAICEVKERAYEVAGRDPSTTTLFTATIRSHIAEALGVPNAETR